MPVSIFPISPTAVPGGNQGDAHIQKDKGDFTLYDDDLTPNIVGNVLGGKVRFEFALFQRAEVDLPLGATIISAKIQMYGNGIRSTATMPMTGGFVVPDTNPFLNNWQNSGGVHAWLATVWIPFAQWNNAGNSDLTVWQGGAPAFDVASFITTRTVDGDWSVGDDGASFNNVTGMAAQLQSYLAANEALRGHVVAGSIPVLWQMYVPYSVSVAGRHQEIHSQNVANAALRPTWIIDWITGEPVVTITAPPNATTVTEGDNVNFTATSNDVVDGDLSSGITWSSDIDGPIGTGASINISSLSVNTHVITASSIDSDSLTGTDAITITITAESGSLGIVHLVSIADPFIIVARQPTVQVVPLQDVKITIAIEGTKTIVIQGTATITVEQPAASAVMFDDTQES